MSIFQVVLVFCKMQLLGLLHFHNFRKEKKTEQFSVMQHFPQTLDPGPAGMHDNDAHLNIFATRRLNANKCIQHICTPSGPGENVNGSNWSWGLMFFLLLKVG